jgi:hypothetical protein
VTTLVGLIALGLEISFPKIEHQAVQMKSGRQIVNAVFAHRIAHHVKLLAGGDQCVDKRQFIVRMYIVVIGAVNNK